MHKGHYGHYSGNYKFSKRQDEDYDAKEAYNKNLTASARLHYLENDRHDHNSPAHQEQGDFDYEDPNYRETREYKRFQRRQEREERKRNRKSKRNAVTQKHCIKQ